MGGINESILPSDKKPAGNILAPDTPVPETIVLDLAESGASSNMANFVNAMNRGTRLPRQNQSIRQHMSNGQVHLHVDDNNLAIKVAVPVAEWYVIMRQLRSLNTFTFVDTENKSVAYFRPYIYGDLFEVAIELAPIQIGPRFNDMNVVTGKR